MKEFNFKAPCNLGQTIYTIPSYGIIGKNLMYNKELNKIYERVVDSITFDKNGYYIISYIDYVPYYSNSENHEKHYEEDKTFNEDWFLTYEEANSKLNEYIKKWTIKLRGIYDL